VGFGVQVGWRCSREATRRPREPSWPRVVRSTVTPRARHDRLCIALNLVPRRARNGAQIAGSACARCARSGAQSAAATASFGASFCTRSVAQSGISNARTSALPD